MKNLNVKRFALAIFVTFAVSFFVVAYGSGKKVSDLWSAFVIGYKTVPIVLFIVGIFVTHLWRWRVFQGWLVPFPDLNGTWQGTIQSTWKNPTTGDILPPIPAILTIKQSFIRISCVMRTAEMTSRSFLADFWLDGDEQIKMLGYSYQSSPLPSVQDRSQPHGGTMIFELIGDPVAKLKGFYWTARKTTGEVTLTFRDRQRLEEVPADLGAHPMSTTP